MANPVTEAGAYKNFTATTTLALPGMKMLGVLCNSTTAGTLAVADGATAVCGAITLTAGQFYPMPFEAKTSAVFTVTGTADCTAFFSM